MNHKILSLALAIIFIIGILGSASNNLIRAGAINESNKSSSEVQNASFSAQIFFSESNGSSIEEPVRMIKFNNAEEKHSITVPTNDAYKQPVMPKKRTCPCRGGT